MHHHNAIRIAVTSIAAALIASGVPFAGRALAAPAPAASPAAAPAATPMPALVLGNENAETTKLSKQVIDGLRRGKLDRTILADALNKTITDAMIAQAQGAFAPGAPPEWTYLGQYPQLPETPRQVYRVRFSDFTVIVQSHLDKDSKIDLFAVAPDKSQ